MIAQGSSEVVFRIWNLFCSLTNKKISRLLTSSKPGGLPAQ